MIVPFSVLVVGLALVFGSRESAFETKQDANIKKEKPKRDAAGEMSEWLLKEGEKRLVSSDPRGASDAAKLAAFFGESAGAAKFLERAQRNAPF